VSDRLSIGECARRAGLSVSALRFYGDRGLLPPAEVDPVTGYRAYGEHEVAVAVTIRDLRRLGMPLAGVATYLAAGPDPRRALLDAHLAAWSTGSGTPGRSLTACARRPRSFRCRLPCH
jgi:DNA polymerase III subunit beta